MTNRLILNGKTVSIACCSLILLSVVALGLTIRGNNGVTQTANRRVQESSRAELIDVVRQIEESPDQALTIAGNTDCPLRISDAKVKEISGASFTRLTGRVTDRDTVVSVPEVSLVNTSAQTITTFFLAIRDPKSQITRGIVQSEIAIKPGESYTIRRDNFAGSEKVTLSNDKGQTHQTDVAPGLLSERRWIQFAGRSDLFVTIARVDFENGDSWVIKEGEVK